MDRHLPVISRSSLFDGIDHNDLEALLHCLGARERRYPQGSAVLRVGDVTTCMGLVLEGAVRLEKEDYWGNRTILASFGPGQSFAEVYACEPGFPLDLNVVAAEDALVLLMDVRRVTSLCPASCAFHARLVRNLLGIVAPSCCHTCPTRPKLRKRAGSPSRSTARSLPTTCPLTAAPCAPSCRG